jgi:acyl carrier protein
MNRFLALVVIVLTIGCSGRSQIPSSAPTAKNDSEAAVRAAMATIFKIDPSAIDMDRPLGEPPTKADELDLVELVMEIEERLQIEISEKQVEALLGGDVRKGPIRVTPAQLVTLAKEGKPARPKPNKR